MFLVFFLFLFLIFYIIAILCSNLKVSIGNVKKSNYKMNVFKKGKMFIKIEFYLFNKIKIFGKKISKEKIERVTENEKAKDFATKKIKKYFSSAKEVIKMIEKLQIKIDYLKLEALLGTEDIILTSSIVVLISSILSCVLPFVVDRKKERYIYYQINPIYEEKNQYKIELDCIINIKLVHIIYMLYQIVKRREIDKHGKSSNRRAHEYSYE